MAPSLSVTSSVAAAPCLCFCLCLCVSAGDKEHLKNLEGDMGTVKGPGLGNVQVNMGMGLRDPD